MPRSRPTHKNVPRAASIAALPTAILKTRDGAAEERSVVAATAVARPFI